MPKHISKRASPGRPPNHPPVINHETGDIFLTYTEAARVIGGDRGGVKRVAQGIQSHHKGYHFSYIDQ